MTLHAFSQCTSGSVGHRGSSNTFPSIQYGRGVNKSHTVNCDPGYVLEGEGTLSSFNVKCVAGTAPDPLRKWNFYVCPSTGCTPRTTMPQCTNREYPRQEIPLGSVRRKDSGWVWVLAANTVYRVSSQYSTPEMERN